MVPRRPVLLSEGAAPARWLGEGWAALRRTWLLWRQRARSRAELDLIPAHRLKDLPFDTSTILNERAKHLWEA